MFVVVKYLHGSRDCFPESATQVITFYELPIHAKIKLGHYVGRIPVFHWVDCKSIVLWLVISYNLVIFKTDGGGDGL
jgi:hypothetical protein